MARSLDKNGEDFHGRISEVFIWKDKRTRLVYSYYDMTSNPWKKDTWSKTVRNTGRGVWRSTYWKIDYNKVSRNKQVVDRQGYSTPSDVWRKSICTLHCISLEFLVELCFFLNPQPVKLRIHNLDFVFIVDQLKRTSTRTQELISVSECVLLLHSRPRTDTRDPL